jgi:hypothetical protein
MHLTSRLRAAVVGAVAGLLTLGAATASAVTLPPANGQFDYQIGGAYTPLASVAIVDRDRSDPPALGKYNVCYLNAFQTQKEENTWWKANHDNLLLKTSSGTYVQDPDWPGEILLDTRTDAKRTQIAAIEGEWMDACAAAGFQAIEPDNLDSWTRSRGLLTQSGNLALATLLAAHAHADDLAIAQKNTVEVADQGASEIGFDFAIAEECSAFDECTGYTDAFGAEVYEIEYDDNGGLANFNAACTALGGMISIIFRDRDVVPFGDSAYRYQWC